MQTIILIAKIIGGIILWLVGLWLYGYSHEIRHHYDWDYYRLERRRNKKSKRY